MATSGPGSKARAAALAEGPRADDEPFGAPTQRDTRELKRRARSHDDVMRDVYEQGGADERQRAASSRAPGARRARRPRPSGPRVRAPWNPPRAFNAGDGAGFLLGLIAYALGFAFLEGGPGGVTRWLRAKFFGEAATSSSSTPSSGTIPGGPSVGAPAAPATTPGAGIGSPAAPATTPGAGIGSPAFALPRSVPPFGGGA